MTSLPSCPKIHFSSAPEISLRVRIAADPESRARGLMYQTRLDENEGLLLVFPQAVKQAIWMRNVVLPLSVACVSRDGAVIDLLELEAMDETHHHPVAEYQYIVEANAGWFLRHGVRIGDQMTFDSGGGPIFVS